MILVLQTVADLPRISETVAVALPWASRSINAEIVRSISLITYTHLHPPLPHSLHVDLCIGFALSWDEIIYEGNPEEQAFAAFFVK